MAYIGMPYIIDVANSDSVPEGSTNLYYRVSQANTDIDNRLQDLRVSIVPSTNSTLDLGSDSNRFRDLYLSGNSLFIGDAVVQTSDSAVILPAGSKIGDADIVSGIEVTINSENPSGGGLLQYSDLTNIFTFTPADVDTVYANATSYADITAASEAATAYANAIIYSDSAAAIAYANAIAADPTTLTDLGISDGSNGQILTTDGDGNFFFSSLVDQVGITLTDLSVTVSSNSSGDGSLSYDNTSGVFTFVPADLSTAYSNATAYADTIAASESATAYTNAVSYVDTNFAPLANPTFTGTVNADDMIIGGDLTVSGNITYIDTNVLNIGDNIITLNADETGAPSQNAGILITRGTSTDVALKWVEGTDTWQFTNDGATYLEIASNNDVNLAYSNAIAYADSIASSEAASAYSNAISYADAEALEQAAIAYTNATSYADTIATSEAATAYSNAASYADSIAASEAATAYSNAINYADTIAANEAATAYTNAVNYASSLTTNDIAEANNLYFTTARVDTAIDNKVTKSFIDGLGVESSTLSGNTADDLRAYSDSAAATAYSNATSYADTIAASEAATAYSNAIAFSSNANNITTGTLSETRLPFRMDQDVQSSDSVEFVNLTLTGDLTVAGNTVSIDTVHFEVQDPIIHLASNNETSDIIDIGFVGHYSPDGGTTKEHTGLFRDATDGVYKLFTGYVDPELDQPDSGVDTIDTSNGTFGFADLIVKDLTATNLSGNGASITSVDAETLGGNTALDFNNYADTTAASEAATAYSNATSYADTVAASEAATAYSNATSYADTVAASEAATAYSNAVSYADTTAASQAAAAYANAIAQDPTSLTDLGISDGSIGQFLTTDGSGNFSFANVETGADLTAFSVVTTAPSESGSLTYDNSNGVFTFTPADLSTSANISYVDSEVATAYSNATSYADTIAASEAATAYSNATAYTDAQIDALVGGANGALDTLNELSNALSNDANFAATVTNELALKLNTSDFTSTANTWLATRSTTNLSEGTNLYYTTLRANTDIDARVTKSFVDALGVDAATVGSNTAADLRGYSDTVAATAYSNAVTYADSAAASIQSNTSNFWVYYADETALNAAYIHGAFAHVHGTGGAYYGHAGNWVRLASQSDAQSYADTAYANAIAADPSALTDLGISDGSNGQVLSTDGAGNFTFVDQTGGGADLTAFSVVTNAPSGNGSLTYDNSNGVFTFTPANALQGGSIGDGADVVGNTTSFDVTSAQNTFSVTVDTSSENVFVFLNGIKLKETADYTVSNTEVVLTTDAANGDVVEVSRFASSYISPTVNVTTFSVSSSENTFSVDYTVGSEGVQVYRNGIKLVASDDYTANTGNTIILAANAESGDTVEVIVYDQGVAPSGVQLTDFSITTATASGGGSLTYDDAGGFTFTPADLSAATGGANVSYVDSEVAIAYANATAYADSIAASEAATAYTNATSYADSIASSEAATAYSNATSYADTIAASEAATAYSNATSFASNANNISSGTIAEARLPFRMDQDLQTTDSVSFSGLTVSGDLTVTGNTVSVDSVHLEVQDPLIHLASNNETSDVVDIGFIGHYSPDGGTTKQHTGLFRDASDGVYKLFGEYVDPSLDSNGGSAIIDIANNTFAYADLRVKDLTADNLSGNGASITSVDALTLGGNTAQSLNDYADTIAASEAATAYSNAVTYADSAAAAIQSNTSNFWVYYTDETALNAAYIHGAFAHVHGTGGAYYGHAGSWVRLASQSDAQGYADTSYSNAISYADTVAASEAATAYANAIAADPTTLTDLGISDGANGQVLTTDGAGNFSFTTVSGGGSGYTNADVDTHLNTSTATTDQVLSWNGADYAWVDQSAGGASSNATVAAETTSFNVTSSQNTFSTSLNPDNQEIFVFLNGIKLNETSDYTTSTTGVTLNFDAANGDLVEVSTIQLSSGIGSGVAGNTTSFDVTTSQNTFSMNIDTSNETVFVHLNGIKLKATDDYTFNSGGVTLNFDAANGDVVEVSTFRSTTYISPTVNVTSFSVSGTQNTFNVGYTVGNEGVFVYQNGIKLIANTDYTADSGTDIVLTADAANGDVIEVLVYDQGEAPGTTITAGDNIVVSNTGSAFTISVSESPTFNVVTAVDFNSTSDLSLKDHVLTITGAPDMVSNMRGVSFVWKDTGLPSVGVIAQEMEQVVPEVVKTNEKGEKTVNYSALVGVLIEAVKDLQKRVEYLENK